MHDTNNLSQKLIFDAELWGKKLFCLILILFTKYLFIFTNSLFFLTQKSFTLKFGMIVEVEKGRI